MIWFRKIIQTWLKNFDHFDRTRIESKYKYKVPPLLAAYKHAVLSLRRQLHNQIQLLPEQGFWMEAYTQDG